MLRNRILIIVVCSYLILSMSECTEAPSDTDQDIKMATESLGPSNLDQGLLEVNRLCRAPESELAASRALLIDDGILDVKDASGKRILSFERMLQAILQSGQSSQTPLDFFHDLRVLTRQTRFAMSSSGIRIDFDDHFMDATRWMEPGFGSQLFWYPSSRFLSDQEESDWSGTVPIAFVNRLDLKSPENCGQVRVVYENFELRNFTSRKSYPTA